MAARKPTAGKPAAKKATKKKSSAKKTPAKKSPATKTTAKKSTKKAPKSAATKTTAKKSTKKKSAAKKTPAKKTPAKKSPATKTTAKKSAKTDGAGTFSAAFLDKQQKLLIEERATYERQYLSYRKEAESLVQDFESGDVQFDEESGEGDTLNVERERDLVLSAQARNALEEIDHALAKFAKGTYGICEVSGKPIPKARLEVIPWARECVEYKTGGLTRR